MINLGVQVRDVYTKLNLREVTVKSICLELGPITIHWYGVLMALAFLAGYVNWVRLGRREGRDLNSCSDLLFWIMVSGIIGARLLYVLLNVDEFRETPLKVFMITQGGLVYYGGFLAAGVAIAVLARRNGEPILRYLDFVITAVPLAHVFGRIGCLMNGCCFGVLSAGPCAVTFPRDSYPWAVHLRNGWLDRAAARSLSVHPVQLYESALNLAIYIVLLFLYKRKRRDGCVLAVYLLLYPAARFLLEFLRGDPRDHFFGFSIGQLFSLALFAVGIAMLVTIRHSVTRADTGAVE